MMVTIKGDVHASSCHRMTSHARRHIIFATAYHFIQLTGPRLIQGTYVTRRVTSARTTVNGQPTLNTSQNGRRAIAAVVNSTVATGGVCWPTPKLMVTIMPKWTGSTPIWRTSGSTIGTIRMMAAAEWRNIPETKKKRFRKSRIRILLSVVYRIIWSNFCGTCSLVRNQPSTAEAATINITEAVWPTESLNMSTV